MAQMLPATFAQKEIRLFSFVYNAEERMRRVARISLRQNKWLDVDAVLVRRSAGSNDEASRRGMKITLRERAIFGVNMDGAYRCNQRRICGVIVRKYAAIELPFGAVSGVGPRNWCIRLVHIPQRERGFGVFWYTDLNAFL